MSKVGMDERLGEMEMVIL